MSLSREAGLRVANVFHAGDGNLHPLVLYDRRIPGQEHAAEALSNRILELCIAAGGSITGEHGVGEEKKENDVENVRRTRPGHHAARPLRLRPPPTLAIPPKVFPTPRLCGEKPGEYVPHPLEVSGTADRF